MVWIDLLVPSSAAWTFNSGGARNRTGREGHVLSSAVPPLCISGVEVLTTRQCSWENPSSAELVPCSKQEQRDKLSLRGPPKFESSALAPFLIFPCLTQPTSLPPT
ncbi:hypothetical protein VTK73DRAFT_3698 [Phialemonium thermophilum]|uniref:Uncharacterized protein n=1 Tax=Phialemonium thermophilum TaxID=223376 RepID=A0ABR3VFR7_9PEZI